MTNELETLKKGNDTKWKERDAARREEREHYTQLRLERQKILEQIIKKDQKEQK